MPLLRRGLADRLRQNALQTLLIAAACTTAAVLAVLAVTGLDVSGDAVAGGLVLAAAATLAEAFPVRIGVGSAGVASLANIFIVSAATLYSWRTAVVVALIAMLVVEVRSSRPLVQDAYNVSLYVLSAGAAGLALAAVSAVASTDAAVKSVFASTAFYLSDIGLLVLVVAASQRRSPRHLLRDFGRSTFAPFVTMASTTPLLVFVWERVPLATAMLVPPLVAIVVYQRRLHASLERQRELDRLKDEFVAVVSHELRTPLASVYGAVETLQRADLPTRQRLALQSVVRTEAARLARLVDDVLWVSRLETPAQRSAGGRSDAGAIIDQVVSATAATAPEGIAISSTHDDLPETAMDSDALRRVIGNLVENAVKYSPDGGQVSVRGSIVGGFVVIEIADEGMGIPEDQYEAIFDKFSRLDPQMGSGVGGSGLGLFICRELVQEVGGTISVSPNPAGRGSVFVVRVPVFAAAPAGAAPP